MHSLDTATKQFLMHCRLLHLQLLLCLQLIRRGCGKAVERQWKGSGKGLKLLLILQTFKNVTIQDVH